MDFAVPYVEKSDVYKRQLLNDPPQIKSVRNAGGIGWTKKHHDNFTPLIKQLSA